MRARQDGEADRLGVIARILAFIVRFAPQAMAGGVFIGLVLPDLADLLRPLIAPAVWGLLFLALLRISLKDMLETIRRPVLAVSLIFWMMIVTPVLMALVMMVVDLRPGLEAALVLSASSSSLFSTPALGVMFGLDGALLLIVLVVGTLLVPIILPLAALTLLGFDMGADPMQLFIRMALLVVSAVIASLVVRRIVGEERVNGATDITESASVILLIVFAIGIMQGVTDRLLNDPWDIAHVAGIAFASYIGLMVIGTLVFLFLVPGVGKRAALSAGFISGTRNLAIILAVLPASVDADIPLFFAVGQFPIYIMPMLLKPVFHRVLKDRQG